METPSRCRPGGDVKGSRGRLGNSQKFPHRCAKQDFAPLGVIQPTLKLLFEFCLCTRVSKNSQSSFLSSRGPLGLHPCCAPIQGPSKDQVLWEKGRKPPLIVIAVRTCIFSVCDQAMDLSSFDFLRPSMIVPFLFVLK